MNYILFDDSARASLLPLTHFRPVCDIRLGILTIREKWEKMLSESTSTLTESYLSVKYPLVKSQSNILINGSICPTKDLVKKIKTLEPNQILVANDYIVAMNLSYHEVEGLGEDSETEEIVVADDFIKINNTWDIFAFNDKAIRDDFELLTKNRKSQKLSDTNRIVGDEKNLFVEEGAVVECASINTKTGPVYIGKNTEIMENAVIRGPFALCEGAIVKMSAKIYGPTTIGPYSKVGGELNSVVIFGYSNKAHDGFLGHSVLGEWCNLGADTNTSNLKNTYDEVRVWSIPANKFVGTGLQFCGCIMGDHSKCGINTMFNTGSVIGVSCNIFGHGYQRNFIPSFSWGGNAGFKSFDIDKALEIAERMMERRGIEMSETDKRIFIHVYKATSRKVNIWRH